MRDQYKKSKKGAPSGSGFEKSWPYSESMAFIDAYQEERFRFEFFKNNIYFLKFSRSSNLDQGEHSDNEEYVDSGPSSVIKLQSPEVSNTRKRTRNSQEEELFNEEKLINKKILKLLENENQGQTEGELFGKSIAKDLDNMIGFNRVRAKVEIQNIILKYLYGE